MKNYLIKFLSIILIVLGISLSAINIYGLGQSIRPEGLMESPSRFKNDLTLSYEESIKQIERKKTESQDEFLNRLTIVISKGLQHIHWNEEKNTIRYNQLIPIWENYFLYAMGLFSGIPEYKKYHYANYNRSLDRGIGICGDAAMVMSQILDENQIPNKILAFKGHVVIKASTSHGDQIFDPDFGISIPVHPTELKNNERIVLNSYQSVGYSEIETKALYRSYSLGYSEWNGVKHFITKKYYFEKVAYALKWPLPILFIMVGFWLMRKIRYTIK